jgi:TonB family protein
MAAAETPERQHPSRRRRLRCRVQAPLDVTVLRSGIPDTVPGRSVNLGEGGIGAVLAGELLPGESVAVELQLPAAATPLRARALVRHQDKLRSGMEFLGLTPQQQWTIRQWIGDAADAAADPQLGINGSAKSTGANSSTAPTRLPSKKRRNFPIGLALALAIALLLLGFWWRWDRGWQLLESGLTHNVSAGVRPDAHIPAEVMQGLIEHRVDPEYPQAARPLKLKGVIVLDVVVGRDGSVLETRALNGPEILAQSAMTALRWWKFQPYRINGHPAVVETTVAVEFKP